MTSNLRHDLLTTGITDPIAFLHSERRQVNALLPAVSLFSGGGLGDLGYEQAGFQFRVQCELDDDRAALCSTNFPKSDMVVGPVGEQWGVVAATYQLQRNDRLHLLSATPPCQGMSSSNPGRGKGAHAERRDARNRLILDILPLVDVLQPRIIVAENVMQVLQETVQQNGEAIRVIDALKYGLRDYTIFTGVVQMADYGIPQVRKRAIIVAIHDDEPCLSTLHRHGLLPWPRSTHAEKSSSDLRSWITLEDWLTRMAYESLDARSSTTACSSVDQLHFVPSYEREPHRYHLVADIPPRTGRNAYQNSNCRSCGRNDVPLGITHCPSCGNLMTNRPYIRDEDGNYRLIKGFDSSYRRMFPDRPAATITTASSHVGSDYKIHPWENRVLSVRECADLQTVPRSYDWTWAFETGHRYVARQVIGEALPPWFTYLHGLILKDLLLNQIDPTLLAQQEVVGSRRSSKDARGV